MTTSDSPAAFEARVARDVLEDVLVQRHSLAVEAVRAELETHIHEALASLAALQASPAFDPNHLERLEDATAQVDIVLTRLRGAGASPRVARMIRAVESVFEALEAVREPTIDRVVALQRAPRPSERRLSERQSAETPVHRFTTSRGKPPLFACVDAVKSWTSARRELLRSAQTRALSRAMPPQLDEAALFAEARALMRADGGASTDDADVLEAAAAIERPLLVVLRTPRRPESDAREQAQLERLARACLDDIGALGNLRTSRDDELVTKATARFEERLLARLDALMALGHPVSGSDVRMDVLRYVARHARDAFVEDPFRCFARALVLGCVEGEDAARAAVVALQASPPSTHAAQVRALALATNPLLDDALRRLAESEDERLAQVSLELLWRRGSAQLGDALPLAQHPAPEVRAAAARCLGMAPERDAAADTLRRMLEVEIEDSVESVGIEALCLVDLAAGRAALRQRLEQEQREPGRLSPAVRAELLMLLAIAGDSQDGALLGGMDPTSIAALGWHGDGAHLPRLQGLQAAATPVAEAAARAVERIAGTAELAESLESGRRYRHGVPFTLHACQRELMADEVYSCTRQRLATELALAGCERIDVHGWAAVQRERLMALGEANDGAGKPLLDALSAGRWIEARQGADA